MHLEKSSLSIKRMGQSRVTVEDPALVLRAPRIKFVQVPNPGGTIETHVLLEHEILVQIRGERTDKNCGSS